jgi:hypothetical protein
MEKCSFADDEEVPFLNDYTPGQLRTRLAQARGAIEEEALALAGCQRRLEALGEEFA